jgi:hypothetical protein
VKRYASGSQILDADDHQARRRHGARRPRWRGSRSAAGPSTRPPASSPSTARPPEGVAITAGFEFDVPVRFDTDVLDVTLDIERLGSITSIPLLEIRR